MKNFTTLLTMGLAVFSISLFAQNNRAASQSPFANDGNPASFFGTHVSPGNTSANAQLPKGGNIHQPKQNMHKPTVHAPHKIASYIPIYDSIYEWNWDTLSANWYAQAYAKGIHLTYDANNNLTSYILQAFNGSNWVDSEEYIVAYDTHHNATSEVTKEWIGSAWVNIDSSADTYDANNDQTGEAYYNWNNPGWIGYYEYFYTYNGNNQETSYSYKEWVSSAWTNIDSNAYAYDGNNNETRYVAYQWNASAWEPNYEYLYTYNGNNQELLDVYNVWSVTDWLAQDSTIYSYTDNNNTSQVNYYWASSVWTKDDSSAYSYNANNKEVRELYFYLTTPNWDTVSENAYTYDLNSNELTYAEKDWNHGTGWYNEDSDAYTYNASNSQTGEKDFEGNSGGTAWLISYLSVNGYDVNNVEYWGMYKYYNNAGTKVMGGDSAYYYHTDVLGINEVNGESEKVKVYPNPSSGIFTVALSHAELVSASQTIEIYNMLGEQVLTETLRSAQGDNVINMSSQPGGIYLYRVVSQSGTLIGEGRLIIQK